MGIRTEDVVVDVSVGVFVIVFILVIELCRRKRRRNTMEMINNNYTHLNNNETPLVVTTLNSYTYNELAKATADFSDRNLLGEGGFGYVYKGILPNGKTVAIKRSKSGSIKGKREFIAEAKLINRIYHINLVTLDGYCSSNKHNMMLVYEFVSNQTVDFHLHGKNRPTTMDWPKRMKIAIGSAKGLAYLHEDCHPPIIHRDIKGANILLDDKFEAKVADFGLAKFLSDADYYVSAKLMGTFGYIDPEYIITGKATEKTDVYAFGVVLLELITGRKPTFTTDESSPDDTTLLVDWARPLLNQALQNGNLNELVDPLLEKNYNCDQMIQMITCAGSCLSISPEHRARMSQIVRILEANISLDVLDVDNTSGESNEDLKAHFNMILKMALEGTNEYYNWPSSEHGQDNPSASTSSG